MPEQELAYDWVIVAYFFLGGLSAGAFLFSVASTYWGEGLQATGKKMAVLAPIALAVGLSLLLLHLGQPMRAWRLFAGLNPDSAMSWGAWIANTFFILSALYAWHLLKGGAEKAKRFAYLGIPFAILTAVYTGVLLAQAPGRPLWHGALVPVLFLNGAIVSGLALGLLVAAGQPDQDAALLTRLGKVLGGLVSLELGLLAIELIVLFNGGGEGAAAARELLTGQFAFAFVGVAVILGSLVPAVTLLCGKASVKVQTLSAVLILIGVIAIRYVVVIGGQVI